MAAPGALQAGDSLSTDGILAAILAIGTVLTIRAYGRTTKTAKEA